MTHLFTRVSLLAVLVYRPKENELIHITSYKLCDRHIPYVWVGDIYWGKDLVHYLAENTRILQMFNSEDTSLGTWLAGIKVNRKHDSRYITTLTN